MSYGLAMSGSNPGLTGSYNLPQVISRSIVPPGEIITPRA